MNSKAKILFIDKEISGYLRISSSTQAQLAERLGIEENTLSRKRRGLSPFKWDEVVALADIIGFSLDEAAGNGPERLTRSTGVEQ